MSIETLIRSLITSDATLATLIAGRVYPDTLPQECVYPAIRYSLISGGRDYYMDGQDELVSRTYQLTCVSLTRLTTIALAAAVTSCLSGYCDIDIQAVFLTGEYDGEDTQPGNDERTRYFRHLDFEIWYKE